MSSAKMTAILFRGIWVKLFHEFSLPIATKQFEIKYVMCHYMGWKLASKKTIKIANLNKF